MADSFRASFVLALKDDLSAGLRRIATDIKALRDLAKSMGFKPLEGADAIVNRVDRDVKQLNHDLGATARQAETAAGAVRRMGAAEQGRAQATTAALRRQAAEARQASAAAGLPSGPTVALPTRSLPPRDLAPSLGLKSLEGAGAIVNRVDRGVTQLNQGLGATARQAETAAGAVHNLGAANLVRDREQIAALRRQAALAKQATAAAGLASGPTIPLPSLRREQAMARQAAAAAGFASGPTIPLPYDRQPVPSIPPPPVPFAPPPPIAPPPVTPTTRSLRQRAGAAFGAARSRVGAASEQIGLAGGAMAGISLMEPIRQAAEFENVLTHIAITAGATADQVEGRVAEMAKRYREMAVSVNQSSHDVAESAQFLITTGIGEAMTNQLLPIIAKAATAYNTPMRDAVQGAFSMHEQLKIAPEDMNGALSAAALAAKQGHFSFSDISSFLPAVAAQAATMGITGREGLNSLLAALETSRRGTGSSGQAATNLQDFLGYINAPIGKKSFAKEGVDLPELLQNAEKAGVNPIEAVARKVQQLTAGMSQAQTATTLGQLFHNQEARIFVATLLHELQYYEDTNKKVSEAGDRTIEEDFNKAQNLHTRLVKLSETSAQLNQRVGDGFSWVVPIGTALLGSVLGGLGWMDQHVPGVANGVIGLTGGMLGLVAIMGVLGTVIGPVKAGFGLLKRTMKSIFSMRTFRLAANPWTGLIAMSAAAAYDIYQHWDQFKGSFEQVWNGIKQIASGDLWAGARTVSEGFWGPGGVMHRLMDDFVSSLPDWAKNLTDTLGAAMQQAYKAIGAMVHPDMKQLFPDGQQPIISPDGVPLPQTPANGPMKGKPMSYQAPGGAPVVHQIHVSFKSDVPGSATVRHSDGSSGARGPMLIRA